MEVSTLVVKQKDLGCNASKVHIIDQNKEINDSPTKLFWKALGGKADVAGMLGCFFRSEKCIVSDNTCSLSKEDDEVLENAI